VEGSARCYVCAYLPVPLCHTMCRLSRLFLSKNGFFFPKKTIELWEEQDVASAVRCDGCVYGRISQSFQLLRGHVSLYNSSSN
jgi:hypothetical protein